MFWATNYIANTLSTKKEILNNYRPASLLTNCGKHFEKNIFDRIVQHLMENNLLNTNKSGLMPGDSCIHQLFQLPMKSMSLVLPIPH